MSESVSSVDQERQSMFLYTSVVATRIFADRLIDVSPVRRPTESTPKILTNSLNFWFDSAFRGVV